MVNSSTIRFDFLSFFTIRITWEIPNDNFNEINKYELRFTSPSSIPSSFTIQPEFEFYTHQPNFNYAIDITACNGVGCGDVSEIVEFSSITASLSVCLSVHLSICLSLFVSLFVCPLEYLVSIIIIIMLHVYMSVYLSIYTCIFICIYLPVSPSHHISFCSS